MDFPKVTADKVSNFPDVPRPPYPEAFIHPVFVTRNEFTQFLQTYCGRQ